MCGLEISLNDERYLSDFIKLNEAWITEYFELEEADFDLAANPKRVIEKGGYVFALLRANDVVGVCALFKTGETFQLARMAIRKGCQGMGFGNFLMDAVLKKLQQMGVKEVTLLTNSKLIPAINLYKKFGFYVVYTGNHPSYKRVNIIMKKSI